MPITKNILIVDDDLHLSAALKRSLVKEGFSVDVAESITDCSHKLMIKQPDLILLDVVLPDGNGLSQAEKITQNPNYASVGIILMSGQKTDKISVDLGLESGAIQYVQKPFNINELLQRIHLIFRVRDLEKRRKGIEEQYNLLFANTSDLFFALDANGKIADLSKSFEEVLGIPRIELSDKKYESLVVDEHKELWLKNFNIISKGEVLPSFQLLLANAFKNNIPVEVQLTKSINKDTSEPVYLGIAKDLRKIILYGEEHTVTVDGIDKESAWELISNTNTSFTEGSYELSALNDKNSTTFLNMLQAYKRLVEKSIEDRIYKSNTESISQQRMYANELGFLKAGPKDLIRIHTELYKSLVNNITEKKLGVYIEESRIVLLSIMGHLVSFYRNRNNQKL